MIRGPGTKADHVAVIESALQERKEKNFRYSLRAFAAFLNLHPSALSRILSGKQALSIRSTTQIMRKLKLGLEEQEKFVISVVQEMSRRAFAALSDGVGDLGQRFEVIVVPIHAELESERTQVVVNILPAMIWRSLPDGGLAWANQRWLDYTGQTADQVRKTGWVDAIHPDDREKTMSGYRDCIENGKHLEQEYRLWSSRGLYRWFLVRAVPTIDGHGRVTSMYGAATDIHDMRSAFESQSRRT